ncbi:MAG: hypothetical protein E8D45_11080 [Nitrospira sp.]|nr:MAG: hypothetical protein E8D45_11080 [Nitrospira sp.]
MSYPSRSNGDRPTGSAVPFLIGFLLIGGLAGADASAGSPSSAAIREAQSAFDKRQYPQALSLLESVTKGEGAPVEARRLKLRTLLQLGKPRDAVTEYERIERTLGGDDLPALRELSLGMILPLLTDMREQMRGAAYTALKEAESEDTLRYFEDGLTDGSGLIRALAVEGLGKLKVGRKSPRLRKAVKDQAALVRATALRVLGRSGDPAVMDLVGKSVNDEQPMVHVAALGAQVLLGRRGALKQLEAGVEALNPEEKGSALRWLAELEGKDAMPFLTRALRDPQPSVRGAAAKALAEVKGAESVALLLSLLDDPVAPVRGAAATSLGTFDGGDATEGLKKILRDPHPMVRASGIGSLLEQGMLTDELTAAVQGLLTHADPGLRGAVARAMGKAQGEAVRPAVETLQLLVHDALPRPRIMAARSLGQVEVEPGAVPGRLAMLKKVLRDQDEAVRATAGGAILHVLSLHQPTAPLAPRGGSRAR